MKKILFVEDDKFLVRVLQALFEKEGYTSIFLENGSKVLDTVKSENPDLIVMDLIMPGKDGFETINELKADIQTKDKPIIVLSVLESNADIEKVTNLGIVKYLSKSKYSFKQMVSEISSLLH